MMSVDRRVLRSVWDGRLPVGFVLSSEELSTRSMSSIPSPYYLMLPRQTYLPIVMEKVRRHFECPDDEDKLMWLEYRERPLQWHLPVGVLYDLCVTDHSTEDEGSEHEASREDEYSENGERDNEVSASNEAKLPWMIIVHFDNFPHKEIIAFPTRDTVECMFMSSVKEADQLKHGGKLISGMQKREHHQLWQGIVNDKFDQFWSVNRRLMEPLTDETCFRHVPLKVYYNGEPLVQRLYKARDEERRLSTLNDLLKTNLPSIKHPQTLRVVSQGIDIPHETPLQWLSEHLSYPDNFLYLCIINSFEDDDKDNAKHSDNNSKREHDVLKVKEEDKARNEEEKHIAEVQNVGKKDKEEMTEKTED